MMNTDPILATLMAPGSPYEVTPARIEGRDVRIYARAPENLAILINEARRFGDEQFLVYGDERISYADYFARVDALTARLVEEYGVTAGDVVGIAMQNCPDWMVGYSAIIMAGGVPALFNSRAGADALSHAQETCGAALILCDDRRAALLAGCGAQILTGDKLSAPGRALETAPGLNAGPEDLGSLFFTSGTTGRAKAAALTHRSLVTGMLNTQMAMAAAFTSMAAQYGMEMEALKAQMPQPASLLVFPLFHTGGCSAVFLTALTTGGKIVIMGRWDAQRAVHLIDSEKITAIGGVPTMYWDLLSVIEGESADLSSLMSISCGGQALPLGLLARLREAFPRAVFGAGYGTTETAGAVSQANGAAFLANPGAAGQILPMVDVRIVGDDGCDVPEGTDGEIWVRGATVMRGYYRNAAANAKAFDDGWYKTGDIGVLIDSTLRISDRKTDMVISGGENIYCAEVERTLGQCADIREIACFGVPDERLGERLVAAVTVAGGASADDLAAFAAAHLPRYQQPSDFFIVPAFSHNAMGKAAKAQLRAAYLET